MTEVKEKGKKEEKPKKTATKKSPVSKSAPKITSTKTVAKPKITVEKNKSSFAIFATGGKQYRVSPGDTIKIEKIKGPSTGSGREDYKEGDKLIFDKVLLVDDGKEDVTIGNPFIKGAAINATLRNISRYKTVEVIKYKQKSRYFKRYGHRQPYFEITIDSIK